MRELVEKLLMYVNAVEANADLISRLEAEKKDLTWYGPEAKVLDERIFFQREEAQTYMYEASKLLVDMVGRHPLKIGTLHWVWLSPWMNHVEAGHKGAQDELWSNISNVTSTNRHD